MSSYYSEVLSLATEAALEAGSLLRREFHRPRGARGGNGHCVADVEAESLIRNKLTKGYPEWGYLGEETGYIAGVAGTNHIWLVDPNSGTSAYLEGYRGSSVSIALLRDGIPVLGVVYAYAAPDDEGDLFTWAEGCGPIRRSGVEVPTPAWSGKTVQRDIVLVSQWADRDPEMYTSAIAPARYRAVPSVAYRLALVSVGEGSAMVSLDSPCSWDYAAGHALLGAAGGILVDQDGNEIRYTPDVQSQTQSCFGGAPDLVERLCKQPWRIDAAPPAKADNSEKPPFPVVLKPGRTITNPGLLSRAQGSLLGQLAGDSLGGQVEFNQADTIKARYPGGLRLLQDNGTWGLLAGQPTDDSEMALMLARSIVSAGGYDPEAAARFYSYWYRSNPFDVGGTTRNALQATLENIGSHATLAKRAANAKSQDNGSLMRISPLAIWGHHLPPHRLADLAGEDSSITHPNPVCRESCAVFAVAIAHAVGHGGSPYQIYRWTMEWAESGCWDASVLSALKEAANRPPDYLKHQGWVLIALQNAFYQLLHAPSLEEGVVSTVMAGGDTDTNAAIAGALLGAVYGRPGIPVQWRQMILCCRPIPKLTPTRHPRPRPFWPVDALELAETLAVLGLEAK
ncbi:MAG: inositol monophosphatase family protein [Chloroflexota bacterium]|jgi:ADP-ribosyl-[dinitrogen reductase] hydrolase